MEARAQTLDTTAKPAPAPVAPKSPSILGPYSTGEYWRGMVSTLLQRIIPSLVTAIATGIAAAITGAITYYVTKHMAPDAVEAQRQQVPPPPPPQNRGFPGGYTPAPTYSAPVQPSGYGSGYPQQQEFPGFGSRG